MDYAHLEIRLHFQSTAMFLIQRFATKSPKLQRTFHKLFVGPLLSSRYRNACEGGTLVNWASPYLPT